MKTLSKKQWFMLGVVAVIVLGLALYVRSAREVKSLKVALEDLKKNPQKIVNDEVKALTDEVGKLMVLPDNEQPTIATIQDQDQLKDVPFFSKAKNGDRTLVYVNARKAILYRPQEKRIIEVAALSMAPKVDPQNFVAKVALYNGTDENGLAQKVADRLKVNLPKVEIVATSDAKQNRKNTIVIDLTQEKYDQALSLAGAFGGLVANLPEGETKPQEGDFLVILGEDAANLIAQAPPPSAAPAETPTPSVTPR